MSDTRVFEFRLASVHADDNQVRELTFERLGDSGWEVCEVSRATPPFRMMVCSAFLCQLNFLRMGANDHNVRLDRARAHFRMTTETWHVRDVHAEFWVKTRSGAPGEGVLDQIAESMRTCPVSRNFANAHKETLLHVE